VRSRAGRCFSLSLLGTFLVRSGVLTSVHAFATDPERGLWILSLLGLAVGGAITLFALRAPRLQGGRPFGALSREGFLLLNNLLLTTAAATVLLGTLYPLGLEALTGEKITVAGQYFPMIFGPLAAALCLLLPFGALAPWKETTLKPLFVKLVPVLLIADIVSVAAALLFSEHQLFGALWFALGAWLIAGSLVDLARRVRWDFARLKLVPLPVYGFLLAHAGLGVLVIGIAGVTAGQREAIGALASGGQLALGPYTLTLEQVDVVPGPDYVAERGRVRVTRGDETVALMSPARRFFPVQRRATTEAAIRTDLAGDLYVVLGEGQGEGAARRYALHAYINPLAPFIWIGAAIAALGGFLSLIARRQAVMARVRAPSAPLAEAAE
jgi:cytochrome c-type biogenesis protein CcmF